MLSVTYIDTALREEKAGKVELDRFEEALLLRLLIHIKDLKAHKSLGELDGDILSHFDALPVVFSCDVSFIVDCASPAVVDIFQLTCSFLGISGWLLGRCSLLRRVCFFLRDRLLALDLEKVPIFQEAGVDDWESDLL